MGDAETSNQHEWFDGDVDEVPENNHDDISSSDESTREITGGLIATWLLALVSDILAMTAFLNNAPLAGLSFLVAGVSAWPRLRRFFTGAWNVELSQGAILLIISIGWVAGSWFAIGAALGF